MYPNFSNLHSSIKDASCLIFFHLANQLIPFLAVPYLSNTLGLESFGLYAFLMSLVTFFCVITDYGFNLSGTIKVAGKSNRKFYINKLIGVILTTKIFLVAISTISLFLYFYLAAPLKFSSICIFLTVIALVGQSFQLQWFFQGMEKPIKFYWILLFSRSIYITAILSFVDTSEDLSTAFGIYAFSQILCSLLSFNLIRKLGFRPVFSGIKGVKREMKRSFHFFLSRFTSSIYSVCGGLVLGASGLINELAIYAIAEHFYKAGQSILTPLSQVYFPLMVKTKNFHLLKKVIICSCTFFITGAVFFVFYSDEIVNFLYGPNFSESIPVFEIFLLALIFYVPSLFLGYPLLGAIKKTAIVNNSVIIGGLFQAVFLLVLFLLNDLMAFNVALGVMMVEVLVLSIRLFFSFRTLSRN